MAHLTKSTVALLDEEIHRTRVADHAAYRRERNAESAAHEAWIAELLDARGFGDAATFVRGLAVGRE